MKNEMSMKEASPMLIQRFIANKSKVAMGGQNIGFGVPVTNDNFAEIVIVG
jgi:hypothetical protein